MSRTWKNISSLLMALFLAVLAVGVSACASTSNANGSTPPKFSNTTPDREQDRGSRGIPQETGQSQDVTNNRRWTGSRIGSLQA